MNWIRQDEEKTFSTMSVVSGFSVGMLIMYLTSIFV